MTNTDKAPAATWSLGGEPPAPAILKDPKPLTPAEVERLNTADTHTGTDPLGRAIGPAEDHKHIKKVRDEDGKVVTPKKDGTLPESASARKRREAAEKAASADTDKS